METSKAIPEIEITWKGEPKKLVFSCFAFAMIEEKTGVNALHGQVFANPDVRTLTTLLWAGLLSTMPDLTLDDVRHTIGLRELNDILVKLLEAFQRSSPAEKKSGEQAETLPE